MCLMYKVFGVNANEMPCNAVREAPNAVLDSTDYTIYKLCRTEGKTVI